MNSQDRRRGPGWANNPITRLTAILNRSTHVYFDRVLKPHGLSFTHLRILTYVSHSEAPRQEDLRARMRGDKGAVAHAVHKLEKLGYLARDPHPEDGRAYLLRVTDEGQALIDRFAEHGRVLSERMIDGLTEDDQRQAEVLLQRMADNVCSLLEDGCDGAAR